MIGDVLTNLYIGFMLVLFFGLTIFVHEFGHYLAARLCGLVVDVFSIGFGPSVWKKKYNGVVYKIGCIPFGGYVALPQLDPSSMETVQSAAIDDADGHSRKLPAIAAWKKIVVSLAGATGNVLLAVAIAWLVYFVGMPAGPADRSTEIGYISKDSIAYEKGLRIGDEILSVNGKKVQKWEDVRVEAALSPTTSLTIEVKTGSGDMREMELTAGPGVMGERSLAGVEGLDLCAVQSVNSGGPADAAGLKSGDVIVEYDGIKTLSKQHLSELISGSNNRPASIKIKRTIKGEPVFITVVVTPEYNEEYKRSMIGISYTTIGVENDIIVHPLPSQQLKSHSTLIFRFLKSLMTPSTARAASKAVGGPVVIFISYWYIIKMSIMLAVWFTGLLNINLAIINLLPIPVLDGGHIVFALYEQIFGRPMHAKVIDGLVRVFAILLIGVFLLISFRDVDRFTSLGGIVKRVLHIKEAPASVEVPMQAAPNAEKSNE